MNLKTSDKSVDMIIQKIMNNKLSSKNQVYDKYVDYSREEDSRIVNYQLQEKNIQLRKQFKKLEAILNNKIKVKRKIDNAQEEIMQIKEKLKAVLNMSQNLEFSLVKFRTIQNSQISFKDHGEGECCCHRRRKQKKQKSISHKRSKIENEEEEDQKRNNSRKITISPKKQLYNPPAYQPQFKAQTTQTEESIIVGLQQRIKAKKQHMQKLKALIDSQNQMIEKYQKALHAQANVGKITKVSQIRNATIKTSASVGSIKKVNKVTK